MCLKDIIILEMKFGWFEFENMVFMFNNLVNVFNFDYFVFQGNFLFELIDKVVYVMLVYLVDDYNFFFVFVLNMWGWWLIIFFQVQIENGIDVVVMSNVVLIGIGLNVVN